jgi:hypothetical protein
VTAAHQHRTLPPLPAAVPAGVAELVRDLTARDPAARPASAGEVAMRAAQLRDALAGHPAAAWPASPPGGPPPASATGAEPAALAEDPVTLAGEPLTLAGEPFIFAGEPAPGMAPARRRPRRAGMRPRRRGMGSGRGLALAVAGVVVVAGLAGWLLAGAFGAGPRPSQPGGSPPAARTPGAVGTVEVNADALAGQQASVVSQRLRQMGLRPRVVGTVRGGQAPGTVISVQPSGRVPAGSTVTVTAALPPPGHGNGNGNGQGNNDD